MVFLRVALVVLRLLGAAAVTAAVILIPGLTQKSLDDYLRPKRTLATRTPADFGMAYRDAPLVTADGLRLAAWFIPGERPESLVIVHGLGSNRGELLPLSTDLHARGFTLLLLDLRAHGDSEGALSTLGVKEVEDVRGAIDYLVQQPEVDRHRIGIYGGSLGGAVALQAAEQLPELASVVVDSTFASVRWVVDHQLQQLLHLPDWFGFLLLNVGGLQAGISPDDAAPVRAAGRLGQRPLLVIHGTADGMFRVENAELIFAAASGPRDLWVVESAGHTGAYDVDPTAYVSRLDAFYSAGLRG
ncbi:MAG TPA: alpha/beta fold hydrolase [Chloroflexota bacterium]|nr:alpha/beta fold hydrolase [Chloroflexota bacterium]